MTDELLNIVDWIIEDPRRSTGKTQIRGFLDAIGLRIAPGAAPPEREALGRRSARLAKLCEPTLGHLGESARP